MTRTRPLLVLPVFLAAILWPLSTVVKAERVGTAYRGPIEELHAHGGDDGDEESGGPVVPGGEGGGGEGGGGEGGGGEGGGGEGGGGEGGGGGGGAEGGGSTTPAPGAGTGSGRGKTAVFDGKRLWNWWWEHNKDRFLARATTPGRINAGSAYYWFGGGAKFPPRELVPVSPAFIQAQVFPALYAKLKDPDIAVRTEACTAIARLGHVQRAKEDKREGQSDNLVVRALIEVIQRRTSTKTGQELRQSAILGLGICGDPDGCAYLMRNLPPNDTDRAYAFLALGLARHLAAAQMLTDGLPKNNRAKPKEAYLAAIHALGLMGPGAVDKLKEIGALAKLDKLANKRGSSDEIVMQAVAALGRLGQNFKTVRAAFGSSSKSVQYTAVLAIPGFANPDSDTSEVKAAAKFLMTKAFKAGEGQIKNFSVFAAGDLASRLNPNSATRDRLLKHLRDMIEKNDTYLQACAAVACGVAGDGLAADAMLKVLSKTKDSHVLSALCVGLGLLRHTQSAPRIRDQVMLQSRVEADSRGDAALGMALCGDTTRIEDIGRFHSQKGLNRQIKRHTPVAIGVLGGKDEAKYLLELVGRPFDKKDMTAVTSAAYGLSWLRDQAAAEALLELIKHDKAQVRGMAVIALGRIGARDRIDPLTRCFTNMSHNNRFRWGIVYTISRIS